MGHLVALLLLAQSGQIRATDLNVGGAADVRGYRRGVDSLGYDPAAAAFADGVELQYRQRFGENQRSFFGAHAVVPGPLTLGVGYDWFPGRDQRVERATFNLALRAGSIALGTSYQRFRSIRGPGQSGGLWNVGVFTEATRWLSLSLGVDAFNSPRLLDERQRFAYRIGGSIRPLGGAPWLTLGGETRFDGDDGDWGSTRAVIDGSYKSLRGFVAYDFNFEELWFGLSFGLSGIEQRTSVGAPTGDQPEDDPSGAVALTFRSRPEGEQLIEPTRTVEIVLSGTLRRDSGLFAGEELVSTVPYELEQLARNPHVEKVVLRVGAPRVGTAELESIRQGIKSLQAAGKRVEAQIGYVDDRGYMIAAAADHIRVDPAAIVQVDGFSVTRRYYASALRKVGVRFTAIAIGDYKSAPDTYIRSDSTPESDEVTGELLDQLYGMLVRVLVEDRGKTEAEATALIDRGIFTAQDALEVGLADELLYPAESDVVPPKPVRGVSLSSVARPRAEWGSLPKIEIIPVVGAISQSGGSPIGFGGGATAPAVVRRLERAMGDSSVKAVVLFINSPGGEVGASDVMWRAIKRLASKKPVITCMGNVAASGGYWIATATDTIVAQPGTITGSIGIFQLKPDIERLYDMLEISAKVDKRGALSDVRSETRSITDEERAKVTAVIEKEYDRFIEKVAVGRKLEPARVREIAGGRVYTGVRAMELGLVDEMGGLTRAITIAAQRAGLPVKGFDVTAPVGRSLFTKTLRNLASVQADVDLIDMIEATIERVVALQGKSLAILPTMYEVEW